MKLFFHIGLNKAGSTYLQDFFSFNEQKLAEAGVFYPGACISSGLGGAQSGNATGFAIDLGSGDTEKAKKFLLHVVELAISKKMTSILLSTEAMYHRLLKKPVIDAFKKICKEAGISDIHLLVVFRDPVSHAISAFTHRAGVVTHSPFEKWLSEGYEFYEELRLFLSSLAQEKDFRILAVPYTTTGLADAAQEFLQVVSLEKPSKSFSNVSINCVEAEIVRLVSTMGKDMALQARRNLKEINKKDKAPDFYLRSRMQESAFSHAAAYKPEIAELQAMLGDATFLRSPGSETKTKLFDDCGTPYFLLSKAQVFALIKAAAKKERPNIFRRLARRLFIPVKRLKNRLQKL